MGYAESDYDLHRRRQIIAIWLFILCAMVFAMIVLGGVTRLTHSGLSMVDWKPLTRWLPPMSHAEWQHLFDLYKQFPEYQKVNEGMDLAGFQSIFWLEFLHRLWGRVIGIAFFVPFVFFIVRGWVEKPMRPKLAIMFVLGGFQGVLGWYMVKSGLVDNPDVSQYRLTAHLTAALAIYGYMFWTALDLIRPRVGVCPRAAMAANGLAALILITIISGGFVAGLDAGLIYNTFPLMDGQLVPAGYMVGEPWYLTFFEDIETVQFDHRVLAMTTLSVLLVLAFLVRKAQLPGRASCAALAVIVTGLAQVALGISTLLLVVPVHLAATHQAGAVVLFSAALWLASELRVEKS